MRQGSAIFGGKGTEVRSFSQDKGTMEQAQHLATGRHMPGHPVKIQNGTQDRTITICLGTGSGTQDGAITIFLRKYHKCAILKVILIEVKIKQIV